MVHTIYVDSRAAAFGTDSDFSITLRETIHVEPGARIRVDKVRFVDSFLTTDLGNFLYYVAPGRLQFTHYEIPEQAYTPTRLAAAIQNATGRSTTYTEATNQIRQQIFEPFTLLTDQQLKQYSTEGFPGSATHLHPRSLNSILGPFFTEGEFIVFTFPKMSPYDDLYLRSSKLSCQNVHGVFGEHDVLCKITVDQGVARVQSDDSPSDIYNDIMTTSLKTIDFKLTDHLGQPVNLRGRSLSFQITIDQ